MDENNVEDQVVVIQEIKKTKKEVEVEEPVVTAKLTQDKVVGKNEKLVEYIDQQGKKQIKVLRRLQG